MGRDLPYHYYQYLRYSFNPRARMGRDCGKFFRSISSFVSTHAPAWGATLGLQITFSSGQFQPTRPHGARLIGCRMDDLFETVSTHAPAWGATPDGLRKLRCLQVSTHAPAWGATLVGGTKRTEISVSTHAPAWGATILFWH